MGLIEETGNTLENIAATLKSVDSQLADLLSLLRSGKTVSRTEAAPNKSRLLNTREASKLTGLSQYELRKGAKAGRYPVIEIGDEQIKRLRWNPDALMDAIQPR